MFLGQTAVAPAQLYAALLLSNPGETGVGVEVQYPGYLRQLATFTEPAVEANGVSVMTAADLTYPRSDIAAGTATHVGLYDSQLGGNMIAYNTLDEPIPITARVAPYLQAGMWHYLSAGNFTKAFKTAVMNLLRRQNLVGFTPNIALYNGDPDNGGSELSGGNYARFPVSFSAPSVQSAGQSMIEVSASASSPMSNANWGTWTHTAICTAATGGMVAAYREEDESYVMGVTKQALIAPGDLSVSLN